jgi:predicted nucleotidyltransferase
MAAHVSIPSERIAEFCRKHHILRLALFGSVLRDDFAPESDIDVLVEFEPGHPVGLLKLAGMERELSELFGGRRVDMNTPKMLSPYYRDRVVAEAEQVYVAA